MNPQEQRTLRQRYKAHVERREHSSTLRPGQMNLAQDMLSWLYERDEARRDYHSRGYFVRPTGTGKTVSLIDFIIGINSSQKTGELRWDKRVLVLTPTNVLNRQFAAEMGVEAFRTPGKRYAFDLSEERIGVYDAEVADRARRQEPLQRDIVVMTYDSFVRAVSEDRLNVGDFASVLLDEVHTRPRGDNTGRFIREHVFNEATGPEGQIIRAGDPPALTIGATATHLYKSGFTIGDYLFGGDEPIHLTRINDAVDNREIAGYRNVVVETTYNSGARVAGEDEMGAGERAAVLKQEARDAAAIRILQHGHDPITRKAYRGMKSVWYCKDVNHAERLAERINAAIGADADQPYAQAVSGRQGRREFFSVIANYKRGGENAPKALTNADILIQGFDDERAELCFMPWPSGSPIEVLQMGGRVLRTHRLKPHATIFNFPDPEKDSPLFGELAGGFHSFPRGYEFPPSMPRTPGGEPQETPWPDAISDLNAHHLTHDIERFAARRRTAQASNKKPDHMLTTAEMSRRIGIAKEVLEQYVYKPLQGLFDQRHARTTDFDIRDAFGGDDTVYINGQRFAVGSTSHPGMGYYKTGPSDAEFCLSQEAANACRFALFGKLPQAKPYLYNKESSRRLVDIPESRMQEIAAKIEEAYHRRNNFQRALDIDGVKLHLDYDVTYCIDRQQPKLYFSAEGLQKLHQIAHGSTADQALEWWAEHPDQLHAVKSPSWLNKEEMMHQLDIHPRNGGYREFNDTWKTIEKAHKQALQNHDDGAHMPGNKWVQCGYKRTEVLPNARKEFCLNVSEADWLQTLIGTETGAPRRRNNGGRGRA